MIRKLLKFDIQKTIKFCFATNKYPKKESDQNSLYFQKIQLRNNNKSSHITFILSKKSENFKRN